MIWIPEKIDALRKCIADGLSAGQTAAKLPCTRNAAIGKAHRLGLKFGGLAPAEPYVRRAPTPETERKQPRRVMTAEQVATMRQLADTFHTRQQVADALGLPVYTIAKRALALKVHFRGNEPGRRRMVLEKRDRKPDTACAPTPPPAAEGVGSRSARLMDLAPRQCRWVVQDAPRGRMDEALMCGEPSDGGAYCAHHTPLTRVSHWRPPYIAATTQSPMVDPDFDRAAA